MMQVKYRSGRERERPGFLCHHRAAVLWKFLYRLFRHSHTRACGDVWTCVGVVEKCTLHLTAHKRDYGHMQKSSLPFFIPERNIYIGNVFIWPAAFCLAFAEMISYLCDANYTKSLRPVFSRVTCLEFPFSPMYKFIRSRSFFSSYSAPFAQYSRSQFISPTLEPAEQWKGRRGILSWCRQVVANQLSRFSFAAEEKRTWRSIYI